MHFTAGSNAVDELPLYTSPSIHDLECPAVQEDREICEEGSFLETGLRIAFLCPPSKERGLYALVAITDH